MLALCTSPNILSAEIFIFLSTSLSLSLFNTRPFHFNNETGRFQELEEAKDPAESTMADFSSTGGQLPGINFNSNNNKVRTPTQTFSSSSASTPRPQRPQHAMDSATAAATCKKLVSILALDAGYEGITASALESLTLVFETCKHKTTGQVRGQQIMLELWDILRVVFHDTSSEGSL